MRGESLKTAPRGYPMDHPDLDLLRLKRVTVWREITDRQLASQNLLRETLVTFKAMGPFLRYLEDLA